MIRIACEHRARHPQGPSPEVVAIIRHPSGADFGLCRSCLDEVLDCCDERPDAEPVAIAWRTLDPLTSAPTGG